MLVWGGGWEVNFFFIMWPFLHPFHLFKRCKEVLFAWKLPHAKSNSPGHVTVDSQHCNWNWIWKRSYVREALDKATTQGLGISGRSLSTGWSRKINLLALSTPLCTISPSLFIPGFLSSLPRCPWSIRHHLIWLLSGSISMKSLVTAVANL